MQLIDIYPWGNNASHLCRALDDEKLLCEVFSGPQRYPMRAAFLSVAGDLKTDNILPPSIFIPSKLADDQAAGPFLVQMLSNPEARQHLAAQQRLLKSILGIDAPFSEVLGETFQRWFDDPSYAHSAPAWSNCLTKGPKQERHLQFSQSAFDNLIKSVDNPLKRTSYHRFMVLVATFAIVDPEHSIWIVSKVLNKFPKVATWVAPYGASEAQINGLIKQANHLVQPSGVPSINTDSPSPQPTPTSNTPASSTPSPALKTSPANPAANPTPAGSVQLKLHLDQWAAHAQETAALLRAAADTLTQRNIPADTDALVRALAQSKSEASTLMADARALAASLALTEHVSSTPAGLDALILQVEQCEFEQNLINQKLHQARTLLARINSLSASEADAKSLAPLLALAADTAKTLTPPPRCTADTGPLDALLAKNHPFASVLALLDHDSGSPDTHLNEDQLDQHDTLVISTFGVGFQRKLHQGRFTFAQPREDHPAHASARTPQFTA